MLAIKRVTDRIGRVRLEVFGPGAEEARQLLERGLEGSDIDLAISGTAVAGVACGLPVMGYRAARERPRN